MVTKLTRNNKLRVSFYHFLEFEVLNFVFAELSFYISFCFLFLVVAILLYTYILGVFTERPNSKQLEHNVVYIPITTSGHATSVTSK